MAPCILHLRALRALDFAIAVASSDQRWQQCPRMHCTNKYGKRKMAAEIPWSFNLHEDKQVMDDGTSLFLIQYKTRLSGVLKEPIRNAEIS